MFWDVNPSRAVTTTCSDDNTHSMRHAPYQGTKPNRHQGNPGLLHSHRLSGRRGTLWGSYPEFWIANPWQSPGARAVWEEYHLIDDHRRCIKVSLGHRVGLWEWYLAARNRGVMVRTDRQRPARRISWALNPGLERNLVTCIILSKHRFSWN